MFMVVLQLLETCRRRVQGERTNLRVLGYCTVFLTIVAPTGTNGAAVGCAVVSPWVAVTLPNGRCQCRKKNTRTEVQGDEIQAIGWSFSFFHCPGWQQFLLQDTKTAIFGFGLSEKNLLHRSFQPRRWVERKKNRLEMGIDRLAKSDYHRWLSNIFRAASRNETSRCRYTCPSRSTFMVHKVI